MAYDYFILGLYGLAYLICSVIVIALFFSFTIWLESWKKKMDDADYCPHCGGTGFDKWWTPCQRCKTTGYIPKERTY